jgi:hypothetical protein
MTDEVTARPLEVGHAAAMGSLKIWLIAVMLIAFGVQWFASWRQPSPNYFMMTDSPNYWRNATSLREDGKIADVFLPMGCSMAMAVCQSLGFDEFGVVQWVHPMLNVLNVWLVMLIVRRFTTYRVALLAALAVACYPPQLNYARQLITEPWFLSSILATLAALLRPGMSGAVLTGLLLGLSILVRSQALGILAVVLLVLIWLRRPWRQIVATFGFAVLVLLGGSVLASRSAGKPIFLTNQSRMMVTLRSVPGGYADVPLAEQSSSYLAGMLEKPGDFLIQRFWAFVNMALPWPLGQDRSAAVKSVILLCDLPLILGTLLALRRMCRIQALPRELFLLAAPAAGLLLFHTLFFAISRYRMPMMVPLICLIFAVFSASMDAWIARWTKALERGPANS